MGNYCEWKITLYYLMEKMKSRVSGISLKVIVLGDSAVGKTSLINRAVGGFF